MKKQGASILSWASSSPGSSRQRWLTQYASASPHALFVATGRTRQAEFAPIAPWRSRVSIHQRTATTLSRRGDPREVSVLVSPLNASNPRGSRAYGFTSGTEHTSPWPATFLGSLDRSSRGASSGECRTGNCRFSLLPRERIGRPQNPKNPAEAPLSQTLDFIDKKNGARSVVDSCPLFVHRHTPF